MSDYLYREAMFLRQLRRDFRYRPYEYTKRREAVRRRLRLTRVLRQARHGKHPAMVLAHGVRKSPGCAASYEATMAALDETGRLAAETAAAADAVLECSWWRPLTLMRLRREMVAKRREMHAARARSRAAVANYKRTAGTA